ncbi:MAG TPA: hypothetical protein VN714_08895 [Trebonia sp.]|jgi:hypothetical protein|nr:hypothetical protein [Trebonia sp.]
MRNRTRLIAAAAAVTAALAGTTGTAMAATGCPKTGIPAKTVSVTSSQSISLNALAARLGVSPARLDRALREVKTSFGKAGTPTQRQFEARLAHVLGIPLARVRHAFPPGTVKIVKPGAPTAAGGKEAGGKKDNGAKPPRSNAPAQPTDAAFVAAVASALNLSTAQVKAALAPLLAAGSADTSSATFAAAAQSLGVSVQQLDDALMQAKQSLAGSS